MEKQFIPEAKIRMTGVSSCYLCILIDVPNCERLSIAKQLLLATFVGFVTILP